LEPKIIAGRTELRRGRAAWHIQGELEVRMALIEKLVGKVIRKGRLNLLMPDGRKLEFGPGGGKALTSVSPTRGRPSPSPATHASGLAKPIWMGASSLRTATSST
jgi:hypothetical protein